MQAVDPDRNRAKKYWMLRGWDGKKRDHLYRIETGNGLPGDLVRSMFLFKQNLIATKDFFQDIDNTIVDRIFKGAFKLIDRFKLTIYTRINPDIDMFGWKLVGAVRGGE